MDDDLDSLLESLLGVIDLDDPRLRERLREGLARGIRVASESGRDVKVELEIDAEPPEVVVLDGGRTEPTDEPRTAPDLEVIDGDGGGADPHVDVKVEVLGERVRPRHDPAQLGCIAVQGTNQTVYRGPAPRRYRLHCDVGALAVTLDGMAVETLGAGCSMDVEASLIQVRGVGEGVFVALI